MSKYKLVETDRTPCCDAAQYALIRCHDGEPICIHSGLEECALDHLEEAIQALRDIHTAYHERKEQP